MNVKADTQDYYYERINKVIHYINNHLDENLDVVKLAKIGNYSPYHFHRIIRAYLGESLGAFIVRLRMETAVNLLVYSTEAINNIAFNVGYENPSSFNKAFKKRFGISPAESRKNNELIIKSENLKNLQPKIKTLKTKRVIYARALGNYNQSAEKAWKTVCEFAETKKLFGFKTEFIGISHDDPKVTDSEKLRYDACVVISKDVNPEGKIGVQEVLGGKFAVFTHKCLYSKLENSYDYIFGKWLPESGNELRNVLSFEKYLNAPEDTKPEKLRTEIYVPIQ